MKSINLADLAQKLDAELIGDGGYAITSVADALKAQSGDICFVKDKKFISSLSEIQAGAILLTAEFSDAYSGNRLIVADPYVAYAKVAQLLDPSPSIAVGIHPSAQIDSDAFLAEGVCVGANAVISAGANIESQCEIGPGCYIGENAILGSGTKLHANVTIYHGVTVGQNCLFQAGAVIGSDGFGYANDAGVWVKIPQTGAVSVGDSVEIGANTCIDRGSLEDTVIERNVIIDNQVHIAHNCIIGEGTAIAGNSAMAGSTKIGRYCAIAGCVAINGHIEICDKVHITGFSMVTKNITEPGMYSSGIPATDFNSWRKNTVKLKQVDKLFDRVKSLEKELSALKSISD